MVLLTIEFTPFILVGVSLLTGVVAWLVKRSVSHGEALVAIQTAFKYYVDSKSKGAAMVLDSPNPTPPEMRQLLRKYYNGTATKEDVKALEEWLTEMIDNPESRKSERSAAIDILSSLGAMKIMNRGKHYYGRN